MSRASTVMLLVLIVGFTFACARQTGVPSDASANAADSQAVPFDYDSHPAGIPASESRGSTVIKVPEGTPITIRLLTPVSSASSNTGAAVQGTLDDPIVIEGQTAVRRGAAVTGRVLAAKASRQLKDPGYLRIALVSLTVDGKRVPIETSSLFAKGGPHERRHRRLVGDGSGAGTALVTGQNEVSFGVERRLTFRLAQAVEFQ